MRVNEAKGYLKGVLKRRYHTHFTRRHGTFTRSCHRLTVQKVRCRVVWKYKTYRYSGTVDMWNDPSDPINTFISRTRIKRKRVHGSSHQPSRNVSHGGGCDPNYSGCLSPNASDYDCAGGSGDGPRYTGLVRVLGNDHYDLDRDGDGVACDDPSASSTRVTQRTEETTFAALERKLRRASAR
jgi:hypothetical protein